MSVTKPACQVHDKNERATLSAFVTVVIVLAIGALAKFDAAMPLFHRGH